MEQASSNQPDPVRCPACALGTEHTQDVHGKYLSVWCEEHQFWCNNHNRISFDEKLSQQVYRIKQKLESLNETQLHLIIKQS